MRVEVSGKQIDVGEALRRHVETKVTEAMSKHAHRPVEAHIRLSREAHLFRCDCSAHLSTGMTAQSSGSAADAYSACDAALARLGKQLRRHQRRLKAHHQRRKEPIAQIDALSYVVDLEEEADAPDTKDVASVGQKAEEPIIVAESRTKLLTLGVVEAVMQMELNGADFLLFLNERHQRLNAVYRRDDGHVGWLDPQDSLSVS